MPLIQRHLREGISEDEDPVFEPAIRESKHLHRIVARFRIFRRALKDLLEQNQTRWEEDPIPDESTLKKRALVTQGVSVVRQEIQLGRIMNSEMAERMLELALRTQRPEAQEDPDENDHSDAPEISMSVTRQVASRKGAIKRRIVESLDARHWESHGPATPLPWAVLQASLRTSSGRNYINSDFSSSAYLAHQCNQLHFDCRMEGSEFLTEFSRLGANILQGRKALTPEVFDGLFVLSRLVDEKMGPKYGHVPYMLFVLTKGDLKRTEAIVRAQILAGPGIRDNEMEAEPEDHFCKHFTSFLEVYADISQHVRTDEQQRSGKIDFVKGLLKPYLVQRDRPEDGLQTTRSSSPKQTDARADNEDACDQELEQPQEAATATVDAHTSVLDRSVDFLSKILEDPRLTSMHMNSTSAVNLHSILADQMAVADPNTTHPWLLRDLSETPFDQTLLRNLISPEMPRQILAEVLSTLTQQRNQTLQHESSVLIKCARPLRSQVKQYEASETTDRERAAELTKQKYAFDAGINQFFLAHFGADVAGLELKDKLALLKNLQPDDTNDATIHEPLSVTIGKTRAYVAPSHAMLRIIDPEKIYCDKDTQAAFFEFMNDLSAGIDSYPAISKSPVLARTLFAVLRSNNPFLELPLEQCKSEKRYHMRSIRDILSRFAVNLLDDETLMKGPTVHVQGGKRIGEPLIPALDAMELSQDVAALKKNFATAKIGYRREGLLRQADEILKQRGTNAYKWAMSFAERECGLAMDASHAIHFYPSATAAFQSFVSQCFPDVTTDNNVVITNQEYDTVTECIVTGKKQQKPLAPAESSEGLMLAGATPDALPNQRRETGKANARVVNISDEAGRAKDADIFTADILKAIDDKTVMVLISSLTRFGDVPWAHPGSARHNIVDGLKAIAEKHPKITIVVDGSQAIGRLPLPFLGQFPKNVVFLGSGMKAMGVGGVGFLALPGDFMKEHPRGKAYHYHPSTLPLTNILGLGLAMRRERAKYNMARPEKNADRAEREGKPGPRLRIPMHKEKAARMGSLTRHALRLADDYGRRFVSEKGITADSHSSLAGKSPEDLMEQFGCKVFAPRHLEDKQHEDYGGIVTIHFPSVTARALNASLESQGFQVTCVRAGERAMRLNFHYLHDKCDIDALFEAIHRAHGEIFESMKSVAKEIPNRLDLK